MELYVHKLQPLAERVLYVQSYKELNIKIHEVDLQQPDEKFVSVNPESLIPFLEVTQGSKKHYLKDSFVISNYLDTFPGRPLYPRTESGEIHLLDKAKIDGTIMTYIEKQLTEFYTLLVFNTFQSDMWKGYLEFINSIFFYEGNFLAGFWLERDELTMADISFLPLAQRFITFKENYAKEIFEGIDISNILRWYEMMTKLPWVEQALPSETRIFNSIKYLREGKTIGLRLPLSYYDE